MGNYPADRFTFIVHSIDYPPPGGGWFLVQAVSMAHGGDTQYDPYKPGGSCQGQVSSSVMGVFARERTEDDRQRERNSFKRSWDTHRSDYPGWLTEEEQNPK